MRRILIGLAGAVALPSAAMFAIGATPAGAATVVICKTFTASSAAGSSTNVGKCAPTTNGSSGVSITLTGGSSGVPANCTTAAGYTGCLTGQMTWKNGKISLYTSQYKTVTSNCPISGATKVVTLNKVTGGSAKTLIGGKGKSTVCVNTDTTVTLFPGTTYGI